MSAYRESADDSPKAYIVVSDNPRYPDKDQIIFLDKLVSVRVQSKNINSFSGESRWYPVIIFEVDSGKAIEIERYTSKASEKDWVEAREYAKEIANKKQRWLEYCARLGRPVTVSIPEETNPADNR